MKEKKDSGLSLNVRLLGELLGEVITEFEGKKFFNKVEQIRRLSKKARKEPRGKGKTVFKL